MTDSELREVVDLLVAEYGVQAVAVMVLLVAFKDHPALLAEVMRGAA